MSTMVSNEPIAECHVWRIVDGRAVEARYFIDSAAMLAALGAR